MQFGPLTLKRCRYGWMMFCGATIGASFDSYGEYSESEVVLMRRYIRAGDTVIDVGANIGDLTVPLSLMVGTQGRVFAVESNPDNFNIMCGNLALNQIQNVHTMNAFIRAEDDALIRPGFVVEGRTSSFTALDSLNLESCHLIKIDVDGNELDVLKSAEKTIRKCRPVLYFENDVKEASYPLLSHCKDLGYNLYWHFAPVCSPNNFFGNPKNIFSPHNLVSIMVLGIPQERTVEIPEDLIPITNSSVWWADMLNDKGAIDNKR